MAFRFGPQPVFAYQAALYCVPCGEAIRARLTAAGEAPADLDDESSYDSDDFPKGPYPNGGGESDSPQHCDSCNVFLRNPLTPDGVEYVADQIAQYRMRGNGALIQWWNEYREQLPADLNPLK